VVQYIFKEKAVRALNILKGKFAAPVVERGRWAQCPIQDAAKVSIVKVN
jgi:hypothetical protein